MMPPKLDETGAWEPLPEADWNAGMAAHLLRRVGWTARAKEVQRAVRDGLQGTLDRLFPETTNALAKPPELLDFEEDLPGLLARTRQATEAEKRAARNDLRERSQAALQELRIAWLQWAAAPENAPIAKWVLFLGDVYVVSADKVRNASFIWQHFDILRRHAFGPAHALTKAVSRSPAMARYLDLAQSKRTAPNENFARELFELFVLGEGNYTEADIKQAARAFTGYRIDPVTGEFRLARKQHDNDEKTIFGRTARFDGDEVIELSYEQSAASTYLPRELARFYLTEETLAESELAALGERWRGSGFDLRVLARTFFGGRRFYAASNRGNLIKSPVQFYLGMLQDLELGVAPLARTSTTRLRQMGQTLFQPPNVRGWVGGRMWINSATLGARRQLVQQLFAPLREETLNADEQRALAAERAKGPGDFVVPGDWAKKWASGKPREVARELVNAFLSAEIAPKAVEAVEHFLEQGSAGRREQRVRAAVKALLLTPEYQLC
jgi:uncharacterized protein (DUF1800 family)